MNPGFAGEAPYRVPRDRGGWRALALAAAVHAGLLFFLWVGVQWQNTEPVAVEAEVWDMKTQAAAPPPAPAPEPVEAPPPAPVPEPVVQPVPKRTVAEPVEPPAAPKPDIALERHKAKLKADKEKLVEDLKRKERQEKLDQREKEKAEDAAALAKEKATLKAKEQAKAEADAKAKEQAKADAKAKQQKELADRKLTDKKLADKKLAKQAAADDQKALDKVRDAEMRRITGATGSGGAGSAAKSTAPRSDSGYVAAIRSKIKSNIVYSGSTDVPGNPRAVFKITQLPSGEIISSRQIKDSGISAYDNALKNAIDKSSPLPRKKDGTVERELELVFDMKDLP